MAEYVTLKKPDGTIIYPQSVIAQVADGSITSNQIDWGTFEYSTTEQVIGKWIDGRLIYRKVLTGTTNSNDAETINHGITNFGVTLNIYGYIHASNNESQPIPRVVPDNISGYGIGVGDIDSTSIAFQHPSSNYKGRPYAIIMEYIKTS